MSSEAVNMPPHEYHADPCDAPSLSASIATVLCSSSPWHAMTEHPRLNPGYVREEAGHLDIGTIAHALMLQGESVADVIDAPDWRTKDARAQRDASRAAGRVPVLKAAWESVQAMVCAGRKQLKAHRSKDIFTNGQPEQTLIWKDEGVWCRARLDWLHDSHKKIDDYKTTGVTANPDIWTRTMFGNGCDIQAAFYIRGLKAVTGQEASFRFAVQETYPPYALSVIELAPDAMVLAEKKVMWAIEKWRECLESGEWPGYPREVCYATLPAYEEMAWLEKETR